MVDANELIACIKKDDVKTFLTFERENKLQTVRLGRFPVLSVVYLFGAKKIAAQIETRYVKVNSWTEEIEPFSLWRAFSKVAGRALRLYYNEVVSPLEMLLLLNRTGKVKKLYPFARPSQAQKARMQSVWSVKYSLSIRFTESEIDIDKRPLSFAEKQKIFLSSLSVVLCIALLVSTPFIVNVFVPFIGVNNQENGEKVPEGDEKGDESEDTKTKYYNVATLNEIDYASNNVYILTEDIVLPADFYQESVSCTVRGNGHKIVSNALSPLFGTVTGTVEDLVLEKTLSGEVKKSVSFLAETNEGTIENVSVQLSGTLSFIKDEEEGGESSVTVAGLCLTNAKTENVYHKIVSCAVEANLVLSGATGANGTFVGICDKNDGDISSCAVKGSVSSDTVDLVGVCVQNNYYLNGNVNECSLTQVTGEKGWNPIASGVAVYNDGGIVSCVNKGNISVRSTATLDEEEEKTYPGAFASGVVNYNRYVVDQCENYGKITSKGEECVCYGGGVVARSNIASGIFASAPYVQRCKNGGEVEVSCQKITSFAGGIVAYASSTNIISCENKAEGKVTLSVPDCTLSSGYVCAGGISGAASGCAHSACSNASSVTVNATSDHVYIGGVGGQTGAINSCSSSGAISAQVAAKSVYIGGVGGLTGSLTSCSSSGSVTFGGTATEACVGGLSANNSGAISTCKNLSSVSAVGTVDTLYIGGVSAYSSGAISSSESVGSLSASGKTVYLGGITASTIYALSSCHASGTLRADGETVFLGGILGYANVITGGSYVYYSTVSSCVSETDIVCSPTGENPSFVGGIVGYVKEWSYTEVNRQTGEETTKFFGSKIDGSFFVGTISGSAYRGAIVGGCDNSVYVQTGENAHITNATFVQTENLYAVGAYKENDSYLIGGNLGASVLGKEAIQNNADYQNIMKQFEN